MFLEGQSHIFTFTCVNSEGYQWMRRCVSMCMSVVSLPGMWRPHWLMYHIHGDTHARMHPPSSSLIDPLVQGQVWWDWSRREWWGPWGMSLFLSFEGFYQLACAGPSPGRHLKKLLSSTSGQGSEPGLYFQVNWATQTDLSGCSFS